MTEAWFAIVAFTLAAYAVLDGFDLGAGTLHLFVARSNAERRQVLAAIGPYWDGNEVWLLATGGALAVAFPAVLASALSGFYLAMFLVLWMLLLRGIAIELRSHVEHPLWQSAWDAGFWAASTLLPVLFGAALGNLIRGLPIDADGWFALPLFTDFSGSPPVGILDWYTVSAGVFAGLALAGHGALYLAWKTEGRVHARSRWAAVRLFAVVTVLLPLLTIATARVNPDMLAAAASRPLGWLAGLVALAGLGAIWIGLRRSRPLTAFLGSCGLVIGILAATAVGLFPVMLRSLGDASRSLTAENASVPVASLRIAWAWWIVGVPLALAYFGIVFRLHRGKVGPVEGAHGY